MTTALDNNATKSALLNAIKEHIATKENIDPSKSKKVNIKKVNIKKVNIKKHKPDDPTGKDKLAKFAWELYHGNRNLRNRDHVLELFSLLTLEATGLEQRKTNKAKGSPLKEAIFNVLKQVAGQDVLMIVALNELKDELAVTRIKSWETFFDLLSKKRTELESIADTVYELAGVSPGDLDDLSSVIVPLYNEVRGKNIKAINWEHRSWWDWAHTQLQEQLANRT